MRDSINYNLKYFIMKTSGTKPMKNTMRKPSPLKFDFTSAISKAASIAKDKKATPVPEGKPSSRPGSSKPKGLISKLQAAKEAKAAKGTTKGATTSGTFTTKKETATSGKTREPFGRSLEQAKALASKIKASAGKPVEGKPSSKPTASKGAFAGAASKAAEIASKATPAMQLKKAGMKKKC